MAKEKPNAGTTGKLTGWRCSGFFSHEGFGGSGFIQIGIAIGIRGIGMLNSQRSTLNF